MRATLFFLLFPVWAAAQPTEIAPEQVVGFAWADLNEDGYDERLLLALDGEGGVDLFILSEDAPTVFIRAFVETTRFPPTISALGTSTIEVSLHSTDGLGSHDKSWLIEWDWQNKRYAVVGLGLETVPRLADEPSFHCGIDFLVGAMRTVTGEAAPVLKEISVSPSPLLSPVSEANFSLCYN